MTPKLKAILAGLHPFLHRAHTIFFSGEIFLEICFLGPIVFTLIKQLSMKLEIHSTPRIQMTSNQKSNIQTNMTASLSS